MKKSERKTNKRNRNEISVFILCVGIIGIFNFNVNVRAEKEQLTASLEIHADNNKNGERLCFLQSVVMFLFSSSTFRMFCKQKSTQLVLDEQKEKKTDKIYQNEYLTKSILLF